ncbi:efflux RND transporter periplasmic adaptor subunit [Bryobacter aggregatus]|uniref:efflux RND transporter periplasmic adaptor subunit n=1 Tax=Bryobacter aggregatus TaxID=360054 RepID=UPI0004E21E43|nr:efflux RND transporter periplasmic adaptor subunit [Bryobacter aggregatus]
MSTSTSQAAPTVSKWLVLFVAAIAIIIGYFVYAGLHNRVSAEANLKTETERAAIATVNVVSPTAGAPMQEIVLPGNVQAFSDTPIYARTSGYLKAWHFDIGSHVKQGQLLAEIETPEVEKQLAQARAELATAQASLNLAKSTAERWQGLLQSNSVSRQETDEKIASLNVQRTSFDAVQSNVHRLEDLNSFQKIYAPFDGVITARNTDIGALIAAGVGTVAGKELFHLSAIQRLRIFVNVPQVYAAACRPGSIATLSLQEMPDKKFSAKLVRTANAIDPLARTLLTEFEMDNARGTVLPGAYVSVRLRLSEQTRAVTIPSTTLLFRGEGLRVAVVHNGQADLVPITIGRDFGDAVEVLSGLTPDAKLITNPADSLTSGTKVRIVQ